MDKDEVKKSPKANLEKHRSTFILIGLVFAVAVLFFAFEWTSATEKVDEAIIVQDILAEEEIEITRRDAEPPPPRHHQLRKHQKLSRLLKRKYKLNLKFKLRMINHNDKCKHMYHLHHHSQNKKR
jgi:protein TonB